MAYHLRSIIFEQISTNQQIFHTFFGVYEGLPQREAGAATTTWMCRKDQFYAQNPLYIDVSDKSANFRLINESAKPKSATRHVPPQKAF